MGLTSEDIFRLNVLLANKPLAIRIDESRMIVWGLSERGESKVPLHPEGRPEHYVRSVRELISGHILGSPGGYPVYLRRWTRMGQMRDESLEQLLMLGEPEAVVAAVCAPGLTDELARRAWWAMEDAENARHMLANPAIVAGKMGRVLARYLLEFLPFETETEKMTASVRLILQPGLIDAEDRLSLWKKSARKQAYLVGFLQALPDDLPQPVPARTDVEDHARHLRPLAQAGNPCAALLLRVRSSPGQTFLKTLATVLAKPPTQDLVQATFDLVRAYFSPLRPDGDPDLPLAALVQDAQDYAHAGNSPEDVRACCDAAPGLAPEISAMRLLSGLGYGVLRPVLRDSTAIGSLMRRKLQPVIDPLLEQIDRLRGKQ
ncbi:sulfur reduction protein DsrS [Candidatus Thiosymbion oneisti]|uniref:sulfur reduction protein DsrS n=1 Tax=Candidatus Thiosymbion oneisti TaxID=589554 RepID=UPI00105B4674|nr:sulfur reduction protein DsrS [Candidatus Thiosymbion oneisti]